MKERIDELIAERAPWLYSGRLGTRWALRGLKQLLGYPLTLSLAEQFRDVSARDIMSRMAERIALDVEVSGLHHLPSSGAAMLVANHPTGIADGIIVWNVLSRVRGDTFFYANRDILRVFPQMEAIIAPVEWREEKRSRERTRETLAYTRTAMAEERLGVLFPSGRIAKRRGLKLYEREWMPSAVSIARKMDVPLVPLNVQARNSLLFYLFDLVHPTLRDITLFHETLNKDRQPFRLAFGKPVMPSALGDSTSDALAALRARTLGLGGEDVVAADPAVSWPRYVVADPDA